jgi:hypothetical protein
MSAKPRKGDRLVVGGVPRAELLPPELELEKKGRAQRRGLITIFVLIVILVAVVYVAVAGAAAAVQFALDDENRRTTELLNAQNEYIEVRQLAAQVEASKLARQIGTATEIDWEAMVLQIQDRLGSSTTVTGYSMTTETPMAAFAPTTVPLEQPRVAELIVRIQSPEYLDTAAVLRGFSTLPAFADATLERVIYEDAVYKCDIRLHLNREAFTNRFATEDNE